MLQEFYEKVTEPDLLIRVVNQTRFNKFAVSQNISYLWKNNFHLFY